MDEYLWPTRHVAEHAYCPRLFYYMEVEGVHLPSADIVQGKSVHKRVDQPSHVQEHNEEDADRPKSIRQLSLTSDKLRLTAVLDLAEIDGELAVPVEYRKGRPRHVTPPDEAERDSNATSIEPWPTDRVQVGLQTVLLEEAGYKVDRAILYYAAERCRIEVEVTEDLKKEALATLRSAQKTARGDRPLPLVNDPKCPRCSHYSICLPDEVNAERLRSDGHHTKVGFRGWPRRAEGQHVIAQREGVRIGVRGQSLCVKDKDGTAVREIPLANVESLTLLGAVQLSTQALTALANRTIPVAFCSSAGRTIALVDPLDSVSADVRRAQVRQLEHDDKQLHLARTLIASKIKNQRTLLMRNHSRPPDRAARDLAFSAQEASKAQSVEAVRGHEGNAAAIHFRHFAGMIKNKSIASAFDVNGRKRRPPPDPVNCVLSFAYTMLTHECVTALRLARLEPTIGAFHTTRPGRPALALDLMEPFRPLIAESVAISAFNRGELTAGHFEQTAAGACLTAHGRAAFFSAWGRRMEIEVTHPVFGYRLSYRRMLQLHAQMIAAWLLGEVPTLSFLTTR